MFTAFDAYFMKASAFGHDVRVLTFIALDELELGGVFLRRIVGDICRIRV